MQAGGASQSGGETAGQVAGSGPMPDAAQGNGDYAIELTGISKAFGPVQANKDIHLPVKRGTIHGIIGENGAGKSTLMSILYGFYHADSGEIRINGKPTLIPDSNAAIAAGIGMVHQHFMLVHNFTVLENVILGAEGGTVLNQAIGNALDELKRLEDEYDMHVDPNAVIEELPVGLQQRVEILKALYRGAEILILDEPTAGMNVEETEDMARFIIDIKEEMDITIMMVEHDMGVVMDLAERIMVLDFGLKIAEGSPGEIVGNPKVIKAYLGEGA